MIKKEYILRMYSRKPIDVYKPVKTAIVEIMPILINRCNYICLSHYLRLMKMS